MNIKETTVGMNSREQSGRGRWLGAVAALALFLGLLAITPAKADHSSATHNANQYAQFCRNIGGTPQVINFDDFVEVWCDTPRYVVVCDFYPDGTQYCDTVHESGTGGRQDTPPFTLPTPAGGPAGVARAPVNPVANDPYEPEPTPTRPAKSVLGGIVATIRPAKLPPTPTPLPAGNRSGIALILRECPPALPRQPQQLADCTVNQNVNNQVTFLVGGPGVQEVTVHGGGLNLNGLPAGKYLIRMTIPTGYGNPVGYCAFAFTGDQAPVPSQKVLSGGNSYTFELGQDKTIYCNWYITFEPSRAAAKMAAATPVLAASSPPATAKSGAQSAGGSSGGTSSSQPTPTTGSGTPIARSQSSSQPISHKG